MEIYYYANSIYQFSYALPVYRRVGGTFIVQSYKKFLQYKNLMKNQGIFGEKNINHTPEVIIKTRNELHKLKGILFFLSNSIKPNLDYDSITIFHEHGTSDKKYAGGRTIGGQRLLKYDYIFLSGPKNKERFNDIDLHIPEQKMIKIGGLRFDDYVNGTIKRELELDRLAIKDRTRENILYAPTWRFGNGTLHTYAFRFAREITKKYNLIIRPHNHDRKYGAWVHFISKLKGIKHLYYSNPINLIKNDTLYDFAASDLMISDISSVIYEYLITEKPMIIIENSFSERHQMPDNMNIMKHVDIYDGSQNILSMIEENLNKQKYKMEYKELLNNCFFATDGSCLDKTVAILNSIMKISQENNEQPDAEINRFTETVHN